MSNTTASVFTFMKRVVNSDVNKTITVKAKASTGKKTNNKANKKLIRR